jgi:hypothetical protein
MLGLMKKGSSLGVIGLLPAVLLIVASLGHATAQLNETNLVSYIAVV